MTDFKRWMQSYSEYLECAYEMFDMEQFLMRVWELMRPQWQPIETSPIDGPYLVHGGLINGAANPGIVKVDGRIIGHAAFNFDGFAFVVSGAPCDCGQRVVVSPTHWMPLPEAPEEERNEC